MGTRGRRENPQQSECGSQAILGRHAQGERGQEHVHYAEPGFEVLHTRVIPPGVLPQEQGEGGGCEGGYRTPGEGHQPQVMMSIFLTLSSIN